jgi:aldose 1-epimerase
MTESIVNGWNNLSSRSFGGTNKGRDVFVHTITNGNGMELSVCDFGAAITSLKIPARHPGHLIDVVLGFDNAQAYEQSFNLPSPPYLGAAVGPYAGRISRSSFHLNGLLIQLPSNLGAHHLHGGPRNLSNQVWTFKGAKHGTDPSLFFEFTTQADPNYYPGVIRIQLAYQLLESNALKVIFQAQSTEDTPLSITQHSYFNLNGHDQTVEGMLLQIQADQYVETDSDLIPTGALSDVKNTIYDFRSVDECPRVIDLSFVLNQLKAVSLYSPKTGIRMDVSTNQPIVHVYVGGNCGEQLLGKDSNYYHSRSGICFEAQQFPDAPNQPTFPSALIRSGETYYHETLFQFTQNDFL